MGNSNPGRTLPPVKVSDSESNLKRVGEEYTFTDLDFGSTSQTRRTPAPKYSRSFRDISPAVLPLLSTSTARLGTTSGAGSRVIFPAGNSLHGTNATSGIRTRLAGKRIIPSGPVTAPRSSR